MEITIIIGVLGLVGLIAAWGVVTLRTVKKLEAAISKKEKALFKAANERFEMLTMIRVFVERRHESKPESLHNLILKAQNLYAKGYKTTDPVLIADANVYTGRVLEGLAKLIRERDASFMQTDDGKKLAKKIGASEKSLKRVVKEYNEASYDINNRITVTPTNLIAKLIKVAPYQQCLPSDDNIVKTNVEIK